MEGVVIDTSARLAVLLSEPARPALIRATEGFGLVGAPTLPWEVTLWWPASVESGCQRRR
jgi:hypothetical protein